MDCWMHDHFAQLADKRLNELLLPGTHDSAAYVLSRSPAGASGRERFLSLFARLAGPCVAPWTLTQHCSIYEQLCAGVRFLDVRVAWNGATGAFVGTHTFACALLKTMLQDVVDFLSRHPGEVAVLAVRPDWPHRAQFAAPPVADALLDCLASRCGGGGGLLFPRQPQLPTLRAMLASGRRLLVFAELPIRGTLPRRELWVCAGCQPLWARSDTPAGTVEGLAALVAAKRREGALAGGGGAWYAAAAVTPTALSGARAWLARPGRAGLRPLAAELELRLHRLLAEDLSGVTAVCLDHPSPAAVQAVIDVNLRPPPPPALHAAERATEHPARADLPP